MTVGSSVVIGMDVLIAFDLDVVGVFPLAQVVPERGSLYAVEYVFPDIGGLVSD